MALNLVRRGGVEALAYPASDPSVLWPCSLQIQHCETALQATVSLQSSILVHGFDDKQTFTLRFDGDNFVPGKMLLGSVDISLPLNLSKKLARQGSPRLGTLSLTLKAPCSVWYPHSLGGEAPTCDFDTGFHQLVSLSGATKVHIVFDFKWIGQNNFAQLRRLVGSSERLTGVPVLVNFTNLYQQTDWSRLLPIDDAACDPPPSYAYVPGKHARTSPLPGFPSPKRVLLHDPARDSSVSPTELATPVSWPSPKSTHSSVTGLHEAITKEVETVLPDILRTLLPEVLQTILPDILQRFLANPSSPSSPSPPAQLNPTPHPNPSSISTLISKHVASHLERIHADAIDRVALVHNAAEMEFSEVLNEHKLEIGVIKDDVIAELERECGEKLVELEERAAEVVDGAEEQVEERAEKVVGDVQERLDRLEEKAMARFREVRNSGKGSDITQDHSQRSISLPL